MDERKSECGPETINTSSDQLAVKFFDSESGLPLESSNVIVSSFKKDEPGKRADPTSKGCFVIDPSDQYFLVSADQNGRKLAEKVDVASVQFGAYSKIQLRPSITPQLSTSCPVEGLAVAKSLRLPFSYTSSGRNDDFRARLRLRSETGEIRYLWHKGYNNSFPADSINLDFSRTKPGRYDIEFEISPIFGESNEVFQLAPGSNACVLHVLPEIDENLADSEKKVISTQSSFLELHQDLDTLYCLQSLEQYLAKDQCTETKNFTRYHNQKIPEFGRYLVSYFYQDRAGQLTPKKSSIVVVSQEAPKLEVRWEKEELNAPAATLKYNYETLNAQITYSHQSMNEEEIESNLQCRVKFDIGNSTQILGDSVKCKSTECMGLPMGDYVPCGKHIVLDLSASYYSPNLRDSVMHLEVKATDGNGLESRARTNVWRVSSRYIEIPVIEKLGYTRAPSHNASDYSKLYRAQGAVVYTDISMYKNNDSTKLNLVVVYRNGEIFAFDKPRDSAGSPGRVQFEKDGSIIIPWTGACKLTRYSADSSESETPYPEMIPSESCSSTLFLQDQNGQKWFIGLVDKVEKFFKFEANEWHLKASLKENFNLRSVEDLDLFEEKDGTILVKSKALKAEFAINKGLVSEKIHDQILTLKSGHYWIYSYTFDHISSCREDHIISEKYGQKFIHAYRQVAVLLKAYYPVMGYSPDPCKFFVSDGPALFFKDSGLTAFVSDRLVIPTSAHLPFSREATFPRLFLGKKQPGESGHYAFDTTNALFELNGKEWSKIDAPVTKSEEYSSGIFVYPVFGKRTIEYDYSAGIFPVSAKYVLDKSHTWTKYVFLQETEFYSESRPKCFAEDRRNPDSPENASDPCIFYKDPGRLILKRESGEFSVELRELGCSNEISGVYYLKDKEYELSCWSGVKLRLSAEDLTVLEKHEELQNNHLEVEISNAPLHEENSNLNKWNVTHYFDHPQRGGIALNPSEKINSSDIRSGFSPFERIFRKNMEGVWFEFDQY